MPDRWEDRLSEYLDGELSPDEHAGLEEHVRTCGACRATLEDLREVVRRAAALEDRPPAGELWPGVRRRIARRISFTLPQLVAAALALMTLSAGAAWLIAVGGRATSLPSLGAASERPDIGSGVAPDRDDPVVRELERALDARRPSMDAQALRSLDGTLRAISAAEADARAGLAADPSNPAAQRRVAELRQQKIDVLRRVLGGAAPVRR